MSHLAIESNAAGWVTYNTIDLDGRIHVAPTFGPAHYCTVACWCHPEEDRIEPAMIIHNVAH